jgi:hypothetical protein
MHLVCTSNVKLHQLPYNNKVQVRLRLSCNRGLFSRFHMIPSPVSELMHSFTGSSHWGESSALAADAVHRVSVSFHQVPITARWPEAMWIQNLTKLLYMTDARYRTPDTSFSGPTPKHLATHPRKAWWIGVGLSLMPQSLCILTWSRSCTRSGIWWYWSHSFTSLRLL